MAARLREVRRPASTFGIEIEEPRSGSHWHCRKPGFGMYTLPAHNALKSEIPDKYIAGFCRHFRLDEAEFRARL
jgi:hypothetical protein